MDYIPVFLVCDPNRLFSRQLIRKLKEYRSFADLPCQGARFLSVRSKEEMEELLTEVRADLLILSEDFIGADNYKADCRRVVLKTTDVPFSPGEFWVNRNLGVTDIGEEIISMNNTVTKEKTTIISIYSVASNRLQSSFAYIFARQLSLRGRVLYISLLPKRGRQHSVSDPCWQEMSAVMEMMDLNENLFMNKLRRMMYRHGEMFYLYPGVPREFYEACPSVKWNRFIGKIKRMRHFDYLVLEVSDCLRDAFRLLDFSDVVFMAEQSRDYGPATMKMEEYKLLLGSRVRVLPHSMRFLRMEEMADYVRSLIGSGE